MDRRKFSQPLPNVRSSLSAGCLRQVKRVTASGGSGTKQVLYIGGRARRLSHSTLVLTLKLQSHRCQGGHLLAAAIEVSRGHPHKLAHQRGVITVSWKRYRPSWGWVYPGGLAIRRGASLHGYSFSPSMQVPSTNASSVHKFLDNVVRASSVRVAELTGQGHPDLGNRSWPVGVLENGNGAPASLPLFR